MFTCKSNKLIALGALGNLNPIGIGPLLDLRVAPGIEESIGEGLLGSRGRVSNGCDGVFVLLRGDARVAADVGDQLVTVAGLRDRDTTFVKPKLEVGIGPSLVEPVAWIRCSLASLVGDLGVIFPNGLEETVTGARRGIRDLVVVKEGFELRIRPAAYSQVSSVHPWEFWGCGAGAYVSKTQSFTLPYASVA